MVRVNLKNFDPSIRDNANRVYILLESYGNLIHSGYDTKTADIDSIVTRLLGSDYHPAVQNLELVPWINELEEQNSLFKSYVNDSMQEQFDRPSITSREARRETDMALRKITGRVSALVSIGDPSVYAAFAGEFNVLTKHYNTLVHEHYGRIHAKTDISNGNIDAVETQPYTGKPVYVIPSVQIRHAGKDGIEKVTELIFATDFTVAYKNNVEPGTATLIITGTGEYTGKLVTTFNIL
jgi:hypothetical protein